MRGETLVEEGEWSRDAIFLVSVFLVLCMLWVAAVLLNIGIAAVRLDPAEVALQVFWEPQLATVVAFGLPHRRSDAYRPLERLWNLLTNQRDDDYDDDDDDIENKAPVGSIDRVLYGFLSIFIIPLWILIGALTLGWLWPPQVREWLLSPKDFKKTSHQTVPDGPTSQQQLSQEIRLIKLMAYEKAIHLEREIQRVRELLQSTDDAKGPTC